MNEKPTTCIVTETFCSIDQMPSFTYRRITGGRSIDQMPSFTYRRITGGRVLIMVTDFALPAPRATKLELTIQNHRTPRDRKVELLTRATGLCADEACSLLEHLESIDRETQAERQC